MKILVAAFDWGLGHATRIVPIIRQLRNDGNDVLIAATTNQLPIYNEHFPELEKVILPNTFPTLSGKNNQIISIIRYLPKFLFSIYNDRKIAKKLAFQYSIDRIISDNRYGFRSKFTFNAIITHQLNIQIPKSLRVLQPIVQWGIRSYINKFDECIVPDYTPPDSISGKLCYPLPRLRCKVKFVGVLSRLNIVEECNHSSLKYPEVLFIVSGPEAQRTKFENLILREISFTDNFPEYLIVRGLPGKNESEITNSVNHLEANQLKSYIQHAKFIICRSGYSTIMDLVSMNRTAMLIPTPGQTEQEYLAEYLHQKGIFLYMKQSHFKLKESLNLLEKFKPKEILPATGTIST